MYRDHTCDREGGGVCKDSEIDTPARTEGMQQGDKEKALNKATLRKLGIGAKVSLYRAWHFIERKVEGQQTNPKRSHDRTIPCFAYFPTAGGHSQLGALLVHKYTFNARAYRTNPLQGDSLSSDQIQSLI